MGGTLGEFSPHLVDLGGGVGLQLRHQNPHDIQQEHKVDLDEREAVNILYRQFEFEKLNLFLSSL